MAIRRSIDLLPTIFRTEQNEKFLNATVDQLIQPSRLKKIDGFIGRKVSPTYKVGDNYNLEISAERENYQLEPSVVYRNPDNNRVDLLSSYQDIINAISLNNGDITRHDRLWQEESYSWEGFVDIDKHVNYHQYYWVPAGNDAIDLSATEIPLSDTLEATYNTNERVYTFNTTGTAKNPLIVLSRQGYYEFQSAAGRQIYIQTEPGINVASSKREVYGVINNGTSTVSWNVPDVNAQTVYPPLTTVANVDLVSNISISELSGKSLNYVNQVLGGIDGIKSLDGKTVVFIGNNIGPWTLDITADILDIIPEEDWYQVWQIDVISNILTFTKVTDIAVRESFQINYGTEYGSKTVFKTPGNVFEVIPTVTAPLNTLYYQDAEDELAYGVIELVALGEIKVIRPDIDIIGKSTYTSTNGVEFTNGMKIKFPNILVEPTTYLNKEYYVEGVGSSIALVAVDELITPERGNTGDPDYITINRASIDRNSWSRGNRWFHSDVINKTAEYNGTIPVLDNAFRAQRPILEFKPNIQLWNHGKTFNGVVDVYDDVTTDALTNIQGLDDSSYKYSADGVIFNDDFTSLNVVFGADTDPDVRNKIFQMTREPVNTSVTVHTFTGDGSTTVFDFVDTVITQAKAPNGDVTVNTLYSISYEIDGTNIVFAVPPEAGETITVTATIYDVKLIKLTAIGDVVAGNNILITQGDNNQGRMYKFDGSNYSICQAWTNTNQAPLFDMFDDQGNSFGSTSRYPVTTFAGTKLFSYKVGTGTNDPVLGFPLSYRTFNNIGDIVFENNYNIDTFTYVGDAGLTTLNISSGILHINSSNTEFTSSNGWVKNLYNDVQSQVVEYIVEPNADQVFEIGAVPSIRPKLSTLKVFVNSKLIKSSEYTVSQENNTVYVIFNTALTRNDIVVIKVLSDTASPVAYYEIPAVLEKNPLNGNFDTITLGQVRKHLNQLVENASELVGDYPGVNNIRDLPYICQLSGAIQQHSGNGALAGLFLTDKSLNFIDAVNYSRKEYSKFKRRFVSAIGTALGSNVTSISAAVDTVIEAITQDKNTTRPFFYSDMVPYGPAKTEFIYKVRSVNNKTYDIDFIYNKESANNKAVLVYLNDDLLLLGSDYTISATTPSITITDNVTLAVNDSVRVVTYTNTDGSYMPPTPTKLGLYPKYTPRIYVDDTYVEPTTVIQGHDGSLMVAYGDQRDDIILELEKRIYNNIKVDYDPAKFDILGALPNRFNDTDWDTYTVDLILSKNFLEWVGENKVDYTSNTFYDVNLYKTWNLREFASRFDGGPLLGGWRANYRYYFDTDRPHLCPWEMLGFTEKPTWWDARYGDAPYTSGNDILWNDIEQGYIAQGVRQGYDARYARPNIKKILPVDSHGNLLDPMTTIVASYNPRYSSDAWVFGDQGPVENVWRKSSDWAFAAQMLIAMIYPAEYFGNFYDNQLIERNTGLDQVVLAGTTNRATLSDLTVPFIMDTTGNIVRSSGYSSFISDYVNGNNLSIADTFKKKMDNLTVNLSYKMAGFTDKQYIKVIQEQYTPTQTNDSVFVPEEDYEVVLAKSLLPTKLVYSGVIIEKTATGYKVYGYNENNSYFDMLLPAENSYSYALKVGDIEAKKYQTFTNRVLRIPYGFEFRDVQEVVNFLLGHQRVLEGAGFVFDEAADNLGNKKDWLTSAKEFMFWVQQNWVVGSVIALSPFSDKIKLSIANATMDELTSASRNDAVINNNFELLDVNKIKVKRIDNNTEIVTDSKYGYLYGLQTNAVQYEHAIVFNNVTVFNDIIFNPLLGDRQHRLRLTGWKTDQWNGTMSPAGFILNRDNIDPWSQFSDYRRGDIAKYKNKNYVCITNHPADSVFNFEYWQLADSMKFGLLPNLENLGDSFKNYYEVDKVNLKSVTDRLGKGVIGYQKRDYLENLLLDDTSQVKFYQGYIKEKGTANAINKFFASRNSDTSSIKFYEEWAFRSGEYGNLENTDYVSMLLTEESIALGNPSVVELLNKDDPASTYTSYDPTTLYRTPVNYDKNLFSNRTSDDLIHDFETAGFPRLDDVNNTVYDIRNIATLNDIIADVNRGYLIWTAKDYNNTWNVFRVTEVGYQITSFASTTANAQYKIKFNNHHNLAVNDVFVIKNFDPVVNGFYTVSSVSGLKEVTVVSNKTNVTITGTGEVYKLESVRFTSPKDISTFSPIYGFIDTTDKFWIEQNSSGKWEVIEFTKPLSEQEVVFDSNTIPDDNFGTAIYVDPENDFLVVSRPGDGSTSGKLTYYTPTLTGSWTKKSDAVITATGILGLGSSLAGGNKNIFAASAPNSLNDTGYIGIFERNVRPRSYLSDLTDTITGDGSTTSFLVPTVITSFVPINNASQISVYVSGSYLQPNTDYIIEINQIVFTDPLANGVVATVSYENYASTYENNNLVYPRQLLVHPNYDGSTKTLFGAAIAVSGDNRWLYASLPGTSQFAAYKLVEVEDNLYLSITGDGSTENFELPSALSTLGTINSPEQLLLSANSIYLRPYIDYNIVSGEIQFTTAPLNGTVVNIGYDNHYVYVDTVNAPNDFSFVPGDYSTLTSSNNFGFAMSTNFDGTEIYFGLSYFDGSTQNTGKVVVYNRSMETVISNGSDNYSTLFELGSTVDVFVDDVRQISNEELPSIDGSTILYDYFVVRAGKSVEFEASKIPAAGSIIRIESNQFNYGYEVTDKTPLTNAFFGKSLKICNTSCSLYVGSTKSDMSLDGIGKVTRFVNTGRAYNVVKGTIANPTITSGNYFFINGYPVNTTNSLLTTVENIDVPGVTATIVDGKIVITSDVLTQFSGLNITAGPDTNTANPIEELGLEVYKWAQDVFPSTQTANENFGSVITVNSDSTKLIVAAPRARNFSTTTFDSGTTFDNSTTAFQEVIDQAGTVYVYEYLEANNEGIDDIGQFAFVQRLEFSTPTLFDNFGSSLAVSNTALFVGASNDSTYSADGTVFEYEFINDKAFTVVREEDERVNVDYINRTFIYNKTTNKLIDDLDFIDPVKGKIPGIAAEDIKYISPVDPADYTDVSNTSDNVNSFGIDNWTDNKVGDVWWNTRDLRYLMYEQGDLDYRSKYWGRLFPGSEVEIYEWINSRYSPEEYNTIGENDGEPAYGTDSPYVSVQKYDGVSNSFMTSYYYWVKNKVTVTGSDERTNSVAEIASLISNTKGSGTKYVAFIKSNAIALFNINPALQGNNTVLYVDYDKNKNDALIHSEYELVRENEDTSNLSQRVLDKIQDSLAGIDANSKRVPDTSLSDSERYGIFNKPRQTAFVDRFAALKVFVDYCNSVFAKEKMALTKSLVNLNAKEPTPKSATKTWNGSTYDSVSVWNERVDSYETLTLLDTNEFPYGYNILVDNDETSNNIWAIYQWTELTGWIKTRQQLYSTPKLWNYTNWYADGFDRDSVINYVLESEVQLDSIENPKEGTVVKIQNYDNGLYSLSQYNNGAWETVTIENGTIEFKQEVWNLSLSNSTFDAEGFDFTSFDEELEIEKRYLWQAAIDDLFVNDLTINKNELFFQMIKYILTENQFVDWMFKTSFISVIHNVRDLEPLPVYQKDNSEYVNAYIDEVKPYRTNIREYLETYSKLETYESNATDFDVHAYYDTNEDRFRAPSGELSTDADRWQLPENVDWYNNRTYYLDSVVLTNQGAGYSVVPLVYTVGGLATGGVAATLTAQIANGVVTNIIVQTPGSGYISTPTIVIEGGASVTTVATASPRLANDLVRKIKTQIKFDRISYSSNVQPYPTPTLIKSTTANGVDKNFKLPIPCSSNISVGVNNAYVTNYTLSVNPLDTTDQTVIFTTAPALGDKVKIYENPGITLKVGDLVSYNYKVYEVNTEFTPTNNFELSYLDLYDASLLENANDRVLGYYNPSRNGFDRDPGQIFYGIIYPGTYVTGMRFKEYNNIYDGSGFDDIAFDNWKYSDVIVDSETFVGDGSTEVFNRNTSEDIVEVRINGNLQTEYADYTLTFVSNVRSIVFAFAPASGSEIKIYTREKFLDEEPFIDINVTSSFTDTSLGIDVDTYTVDGGQFIDQINSHGPEELVTGVTFDTLDITVITKTDPSSLTTHGFRIFKDMRSNFSYCGLRDSSFTYLTRDLKITDTTIYLNDVSVLTAPNANTPGVIFVNGERIEFLSLDVVDNTITQLRRGTSGTGAANLIVSGTVVADAGITVELAYNDTNRIDTHITSSNVINYTLSETALQMDYSTLISTDGSSLFRPIGDFCQVYYGGILLEADTDYEINDVSGDKILTLKIDNILSGKYLTVVKKDGQQFVTGDIYQVKTYLGTDNIAQDFSSLAYSVTGDLANYLSRQ